MPAQATATSYFIKPGYVSRDAVPPYIDNGVGLYQPDVYEWAYWKARDLGVTTLVDVGCGRAGKLASIYPRTNRWRIVGIDYGANVSWCYRHWPWGEWLAIDLDAPHEINAEGALVICADVVEHLQKPEYVLESIRDSGFRGAVFSTPARSVSDNGPPKVPFHVREWTTPEFEALLDHFGYDLKETVPTSSTLYYAEP